MTMSGSRGWPGARLTWGWRGGESAAPGASAAARLERALRRLEQLDASAGGGPAALEPAGAAGVLRHCVLNPPALPDAIAEAELRVGAALPADYCRFLLFSDGAVLAEETGLAAELLGAQALARHAEELECVYPTGCIPEVVVFATVGVDGDRLAFDTGRMNPVRGCGILDARRDCRPDQWWVIARDFTSWLEEILGCRAPAASFGRRWGDRSGEAQPELPFQNVEAALFE